MIPTLSSAERKRYRGMAMNMKPAVIIGKAGITDALVAEAELAFSRNPVLKIRILAENREARRSVLAAFAERVQATVCGESGHTASLYRKPAPAAAP